MHRHALIGFRRCIAMPLLASADASPCQQGGPCWLHRSNWPETDVGAGLPAMRRAGGARSHRRWSFQGMHIHRRCRTQGLN
ncbi:hypothetical protein DZC31_06335 [Stenotrophomonas rhizophila]|nr:hypothetical protein DZC31_06335 [Stenotrophomonas rhizophila]